MSWHKWRVQARPARPDMSHEDEDHEFLPCNVVGTSRKRVQECTSPCKSARRDDDQTWTSALILADSQCARLRWCVAACCIAALPGKRQSARARLRSAALLLCLASAKRRPLQWCQLMTQLIFAGHRSAAVLYKCSLDNGLQQCSVSVNPGRLEVLRQRSATVNSLVTGSLLQGIMEDAIP